MLRTPSAPSMTRNCCFQQCGFQMNPLDVKNTITAGNVCSACNISQGVESAAEEEAACLLASAHIANQQYLAGYCPCEALAQGTMFPELVRHKSWRGGR